MFYSLLYSTQRQAKRDYDALAQKNCALVILGATSVENPSKKIFVLFIDDHGYFGDYQVLIDYLQNVVNDYFATSEKELLEKEFESFAIHLDKVIQGNDQEFLTKLVEEVFTQAKKKSTTKT